MVVAGDEPVIEVSDVRLTLADVPPSDQDINAVLYGQISFFDQLDTTKLELLKTFSGNIANSGILWVNKSSQSQCANPGFGQIHGLARCICSELGVAFVTCEADDKESSRGCRAVADVFKAFSKRVNDRKIEPDFEYMSRRV